MQPIMSLMLMVFSLTWKILCLPPFFLLQSRKIHRKIVSIAQVSAKIDYSTLSAQGDTTLIDSSSICNR